MLARPDFLIPLAAAERQFRDHYYGLNSAALLEDLFFDALGTFLRQTQPRTDLTRPAPGQKGWDYALDGLQVSHKVSQNLGDIAALWDATKRGVTHWSFDEPITYVLGKNAPSTSLRVVLNGDPVRCRAVADVGRPYPTNGRLLMVVKWPADGSQAQLLEAITSTPGEVVPDVLPFSAVWRHVADHVSTGGAANEIDVFVTTARPTAATLKALAAATYPLDIEITVGLRGGAYLLKSDLLQNLAVRTNNRGILIPKALVQNLLIEAAAKQLFAPLPLWFWPYAQERPPDMYSSQRSEFEARFSARGDLDDP